MPCLAWRSIDCLASASDHRFCIGAPLTNDLTLRSTPKACVSKGGNSHRALSPCFETLAALAPQHEVILHHAPPFISTMVLAITASWSHGNRIQVSWLTSVM